MDIRTMHETYTDADYARIADEMKGLASIIQRGKEDEKRDAALKIKSYLDTFAKIPELDELTAVYRNAPEDNVLGFYPRAVLQFINSLWYHYKKEEEAAEADKDPVADFISGMRGFERYAKGKGIQAEMETLLDVLGLTDEILAILNSRIEKIRGSADITNVVEMERLLSQKERILDEKERLIDRGNELQGAMAAILKACEDKNGKLSDA